MITTVKAFLIIIVIYPAAFGSNKHTDKIEMKSWAACTESLATLVISKQNNPPVNVTAFCVREE